MHITIDKITDESLMREACEFTMLKDIKSQQTLESMYKAKHSPIRTQIFIIRMKGIPAFVAHHLRTHYVGVMGHWITSRRDDRGGEAKETRSELVDHILICNAETLMNMAAVRLCRSSHIKTYQVMHGIKGKIKDIDPDLYRHLLPKCDILAAGCTEPKSCGRQQ